MPIEARHRLCQLAKEARKELRGILEVMDYSLNSCMRSTYAQIIKICYEFDPLNLW